MRESESERETRPRSPLALGSRKLCVFLAHAAHEERDELITLSMSMCAFAGQLFFSELELFS